VIRYYMIGQTTLNLCGIVEGTAVELVGRPWGRFSIVAHAQQSSGEDKSVRITFYLLCALPFAILVGLFLYTMFAGTN